MTVIKVILTSLILYAKPQLGTGINADMVSRSKA